MRPESRPRGASPSLLALAIAACATALALVALSSGPARSHTVLSDTFPEDGGTVASVEEVRLEFAGSLLEVGARVSVVDAAGVDHAVGEVSFPGGGVAQVAVSDLPDGEYTVRWRVVAEDGHPLEGSFGFSVAPPPAAASPGASASPAHPSLSPSPSPSPGVVVVPAPTGAEEDGGAPVALVVSGIALAAAGGAALFVLASRARSRRG